MNKNIIVTIIAVIAIILAVLALTRSGTETIVRETIKELGATPGGDFLTPVTFQDTVTFSPEPLSTTTTGSAATMVQADLIKTPFYTVNLNAAGDFTYTLPASSTLTSFVPKTYDISTVCFNNATTAVHSLIFAAGTGIDLQVATGTSVLEHLGSVDMGCIEFVRKPNTDIFANFTIYDDSD